MSRDLSLDKTISTAIIIANYDIETRNDTEVVHQLLGVQESRIAGSQCVVGYAISDRLLRRHLLRRRWTGTLIDAGLQQR